MFKSIEQLERVKKTIIKKVKFEANEMNCWEWQGHSSGGYGQIRINNKIYKVHRVMAAICRGLDINDAKSYVCHRCDNTLCVFPNHLYIGNALTNAGDRDERKRANLHKGENRYATRIKDSQVLEIFTLSKSGLMQKDIAKKYNVPKWVIQCLLARTSYRHVNAPTHLLYTVKSRKRRNK